MSSLGPYTKKVNTYGKRGGKTRIINVHLDVDDFPSPPRPTVKTTAARVGDENRVPVAGTSKDKDKDKATKSTKGTPVKKRAPLRMKNDAERERAPLTPKRNNSPPRKPRQLSEEEPVLRKHIASRRRVIVSRSPSMSPAKAKSSVATPGGSPLRATRGAHPLRQTHVVEEVTEVGERLEKLSIKGYPRKSTVVVEITRQSQSPALVRSLLDVCSAHELIPFESIFTDPAFLACLRGAVPKGSSPVVTKIGEASYSEVFSVQAVLEDPAVIVKIIPLFNSASSSRTDPFPDCSEIPDVVKEITLTRHMDKLSGGGFSEFRGAFVVNGKYPAHMLDEWDRFNECQGSESVRPSAFTSRQQYAFLVLADGGDDLETYRFQLSKGWVQAAAVFWQVADALARAEEYAQFEHRDLHEGQVLVTTTPTDYIGPVTNYLDPTETAVRSTVIDFGLSRLTVNGAPVATPLPDECYEGVGAQWDVYRAMQTLIGPSPDAWDSFVPSTNVLWLLYLVRRLLHATPTLRKPTARRGGTTKTTAAAKRDNAIRDRCEAAYTLLLAVEAELSTPTARGKRTKTGACGFTSAAEVMAWGRKEGWVE